MSLTRRSVLKRILAGGAAAVASKALPASATREPKKVPPDAVGMLYDATLCVGCRACEVKCREVNHLPGHVQQIGGGVYNMSVGLTDANVTVIKRFEENGQTGFLKRQCMHCVDPSCVSACMLGALAKGKGGVVGYDKDLCLGCRYCQIACPFNVPRFEWNVAVPKIVKCDMCRTRQQGPGCAEVCPRGAVLYGNFDALKAEARARLAKSPGRYVNKVYGEVDGGGTQVMYLSAVPFEKLGLPVLTDTAGAQSSEAVQHTLYQNFATPVVLYGALAFVVLRNRKAEAKTEAHKEGNP